MLSSGKERVAVPKVVGLTEDEAVAQLEALDLQPVMVPEDSTKGPGTVGRQGTPALSDLAKDSTVTVTSRRSGGRPAFLMSTGGRRPQRAAGWSGRASSRRSWRSTERARPGWARDRAVTQAGTEVKKGHRVTISVGKLEATTTTTPAP